MEIEGKELGLDMGYTIHYTEHGYNHCAILDELLKELGYNVEYRR